MEEQTGYIAAGNEQLHYQKWGAGKKLLLAFHGYGDTAEIFLPFVAYLSVTYTMISVDLPHHGGSKWGRDSRLTSHAIAGVAARLLEDFGAEKMSLIGYSLGGRVCLAVLEQKPELIERVTLIAPDGLKKDPYYFFFTQTWLGKKMFRNMLEQPWPYFIVMRLLKSAGLVHPKRYNFAMNFLHSSESRDLLLRVWPAMSEMMPEPEHVKSIIAACHLPVVIFMGERDKIIPPSVGKKFVKDLDTAEFHIVEKGHRIIDQETAGQIAGSLL